MVVVILFLSACCFLSFINRPWVTYFGYTMEDIIGMRLGTYCIVQLDWYITFFNACIIIIVANDNRHLGRKIISCIREVVLEGSAELYSAKSFNVGIKIKTISTSPIWNYFFLCFIIIFSSFLFIHLNYLFPYILF